MVRLVQATPQDYSLGASGARDYVANSLQILQALIAELREAEGEPFLVGRLDDLRGIELRLNRALTILDSRP